MADRPELFNFVLAGWCRMRNRAMFQPAKPRRWTYKQREKCSTDIIFTAFSAPVAIPARDAGRLLLLRHCPPLSRPQRAPCTL